MYETCVEFTTKPLGITDSLDKDWGSIYSSFLCRSIPIQVSFCERQGRAGTIQCSTVPTTAVDRDGNMYAVWFT